MRVGVALPTWLGSNSAMSPRRHVEFAIIGAGIAGVATAYYLCTRFRRASVLLIDRQPPLGFTSAQSGDNYRNWWPHPTMVQFTDHSIALMDEIARETGNTFGMTRRGYVLATRRAGIDDLLADLAAGYGADAPDTVRLRDGDGRDAYLASLDGRPPAGVDVVSDVGTIRSAFPALASDFRNLIHIRRAGDIDSQQLGALMLDAIRAAGGNQLRGDLRAVSHSGMHELEVATATGLEVVTADVVVNAAGPFVQRVAAMFGVDLPVTNMFQQKIAFDDAATAIPRDLPFVIDLDPITLDWPEDTREMLAADEELAWLAKPLPGGRHCRPDGGPRGRRVKLGWAYNRAQSEPLEDLAAEPALDDSFPEIVLRGAAAMLPSLRPYVETPPAGFTHYGGYYTMTRENWPLIGPLGPDGAFVVGALSGFGSMAACAAGLTAASWATGSELPSYAADLGLARYEDADRVHTLEAIATKSIL